MGGSGDGLHGRRAAMGVVALGAAWLLAGAHAPYGQWGVYRKRFLLILTTRVDPASFELGQQVAAVLAERLPASRARVSRAPHKARVASLIASHQMDLALMRPDDAAALRMGRPPFADYGPVPLRAIAWLGAHLLVCRADFTARHAWLIAEALAGAGAELGVGVTLAAAGDARPDTPVPAHPGAVAYAAGEPMPETEGAAQPDAGHMHDRPAQHD